VPDLLDDDRALVDALRRYGAAVEAAATRPAEPVRVAPAARPGAVPFLDYPVHAERGAPPLERRPVRRPRRRRLLALAAVAAVVAVLATVVVTRRTEDRTPVVDTPATTATTEVTPTTVAIAEPFADGTVLMWLPYGAPPQFLGQHADRPVPLDVGLPKQAGCCGLAVVGQYAGFLAGATLHLVDREGTVTDTGISGDRVLANRGDAGSFYVQRGRALFRYDLPIDPTAVDSAPWWQIPDGWELANDGDGVQLIDGWVILERVDRTTADHEIGVWGLGSDVVVPFGVARWVIDATVYPNGVPTVAWVDDQCDPLGAGCNLVITNLSTMESRTAPRPTHGVIGGGAFSPDGRHLAVFVAGQTNMGMNPTADLAVVDVETTDLEVLADTSVAVGEPFGSAAWTFDNSSVIYHGGGRTRVIDVTTGVQRTLPWEITYSMATIP